MVITSTRPMSKDLLSIHSIENQPTTQTLRRLSHGLGMDLKQAVQLEKQELKKMGLSIEVDVAKRTSLEEGNQSQGGVTPPHWLDHQQQLATTGKYGYCPPCSPPVPIPQHHEAQRCYSAAGSPGETSSHGGLETEHLQPMSTSQCKARLYELWNYKMSFEYREALTCRERPYNHDRLVVNRALLKHRPESSMTSTAKSVNEDDDNLDDVVSPEEEEHVLHYGDVFVMDDL